MSPSFLRVTLALVAAAAFTAGATPNASIPPVSIPPASIRPALTVRAADVHGDDEADRYVGTGGLVLPRSVARHTRAEVAGCASCEWRLTTPCVESPAGVAFSGQAVCQSVVRGCPGGEQLVRAWFRRGAGPWDEIALICRADGPPPTIAAIEGRARERFVRSLPGLRASFQPSTGVLAQLPVGFDSGQQGGRVTSTYEILGEPVTVSASPAWSWVFGDGAAVETSDPGGVYPHLAVAHTYRRAGRFEVRATTTWAADFMVDDLGPFPVTEPVSQEAILHVPVGEGRAVLAVR
ncbi:MAG: PKD domain-containing protein [Actinobacteria bacterium]|nr:PKD domain-containing protein [Actinomycetota bacterium]